ncbi:MAG: hypothetical protein QM537_01255 [Candidatus Symbiobacter sp.]|nr:hypothetical protein [Candidatus Symbiobacter sp.]
MNILIITATQAAPPKRIKTMRFAQRMARSLAGFLVLEAGK